MAEMDPPRSLHWKGFNCVLMEAHLFKTPTCGSAHFPGVLFEIRKNIIFLLEESQLTCAVTFSRYHLSPVMKHTAHSPTIKHETHRTGGGHSQTAGRSLDGLCTRFLGAPRWEKGCRGTRGPCSEPEATACTGDHFPRWPIFQGASRNTSQTRRLLAAEPTHTLPHTASGRRSCGPGLALMHKEIQRWSEPLSVVPCDHSFRKSACREI